MNEEILRMYLLEGGLAERYVPEKCLLFLCSHCLTCAFTSLLWSLGCKILLCVKSYSP